ncbi:MAG: hypothetical protein WC829_01685 [Hyphomicrobium sp.]|jgi:hypothetical protein
MENEHEDREVAAMALLRATERIIDDAFEGGYAIRNPALVGVVFTALMRDYTKVHEMHIMAALARQNMGLVAMANISNGAQQ